MKNLRALPIAAILLLSFFSVALVAIPAVPKAAATSSLIVIQFADGGGGTCAFVSVVHIGNTVFVMTGGAAANGPVSDSLANSYTLMKTQAASGAAQGANTAIYYSVLAAGGADTVTVGLPSPYKGQGVYCIEVSGGWSAGAIIDATGTMSASMTTLSIASTAVSAGDMVLVSTGENPCGGSSAVTPVFNATASVGGGGGSTGNSLECNGTTPFHGEENGFVSMNWGGSSSTFSVQITSVASITTNSSNWAEVMIPIIPAATTPCAIVPVVGDSALAYGAGFAQLSLAVTSGDVIGVQITSFGSASGTFLHLYDNQHAADAFNWNNVGNTNNGCNSGNGSQACEVWSFYTTAVASGTMDINTTYTFGLHVVLAAFDIKNASTVGVVWSQGTCGPDCTVASFAGACDLVLGTGATQTQTGTWAAGAGFTLIPGQFQFPTNGSFSGNEYGGVMAPTTAPLTAGANVGGVEGAMAFGPGPYPRGITQLGSALTYPTKGHTFLAFGMLWAFFSNDTMSTFNYVCTTSSNLGLTWTSPVGVNITLPFSSPGNQSKFDSYYDASTHTIAFIFMDNSIIYRTGQLSSGGCGAISYNAPFTELDFSAYWTPPSTIPNHGMITIDSSNHAWISFTFIGGDASPPPSGCPGKCWITVEDSDVVTAGTWTSFAAAPQVMFKIVGSTYDSGTAEIVPTGAGVTFLAANGSTSLVSVLTFRSGSWGSPVTLPTALLTGCAGMSPPCNLSGVYAWSAMQDATGNVHIDYSGSDGFLHYTIFYPANNSLHADFKLNGGSTFAQIGYAYPAIDVNGSNIYAFWVNTNTTYYQAEIGGAWRTAHIFFSDDFAQTAADINYAPQISSRSQDFIGGMYIIANQARFFYLPPTGVGSNVTACVRYTLIAGGSYDAPTLHYLAPNGSALSLKLKTSLSCIHTLSGDTYTVNSTLTGISASGQERAITQNTTSGTFPSSANYDFVYWHQLYVPVGYTITDGVATNHPTFTYRAFASTITIANSKNPTPYWIDYNSHWTAETPFTTSPDFQTFNAHPPSGAAANLQPIIIAYYKSSTCANPSPLTEIENRCIIPGIVDAWSYGIGAPVWMGFVLLGINVAIYNKSQSVWLTLMILWVTGAVFSAILPVYVGQVAQIFLYLGSAGLVVKTILLLR